MAVAERRGKRTGGARRSVPQPTPTEHALLEHFSLTARRYAEAAGTITLLVSHRFSTVRMADLIVVLSHGQVVEKGSHEQLMSLGGLYAELYRLQARAYRVS